MAHIQIMPSRVQFDDGFAGRSNWKWAHGTNFLSNNRLESIATNITIMLQIESTSTSFDEIGMKRPLPVFEVSWSPGLGHVRNCHNFSTTEILGSTVHVAFVALELSLVWGAKVTGPGRCRVHLMQGQLRQYCPQISKEHLILVKSANICNQMP